MRKNRTIRRIFAITAAITLFASGSAYAENIGKIDNEVYKGLGEVLENRQPDEIVPDEIVPDEIVPDEIVPENTNFMDRITYTKDRVSARFLIKLSGSEKVKVDSSEQDLVMVEIPSEMIKTSDISKDINDRYIKSYNLYSAGNKYMFELKLQDNVKADSFVNEATGEISISLEKQVNNPPRIVVDAGHGGNDPGASNKAAGIDEKTLNLKVAGILKQILSERGYEVIMNRDSDYFVPLKDRYNNANTIDADLFVSVHHNSAGSAAVSGIETLRPNSAENKIVADYIQDELIKNTGAVNRGTKIRTDLAVLNGTRMPAVLLELGFMSNTNEVTRLKDSSYQSTLANSVADGIDKYFGR